MKVSLVRGPHPVRGIQGFYVRNCNDVVAVVADMGVLGPIGVLRCRGRHRVKKDSIHHRVLPCLGY